MESQGKRISFCIGFREKNDNIFIKKKKIAKYPIYGPFCSNLGKNEFSPYIGLRYFLAPVVP